MNISIGLQQADPLVNASLEEVFGKACDISHLQTQAETQNFIEANQFPNIKILVVSVGHLMASDGLWTTLKILVDKVQTFHLVLLREDEVLPLESLPVDVAGERVHLVETWQAGAADELTHHLKGIKTSAEVFGLKYKVFDLFLYQEELTRGEAVREHLPEFLDKLRKSINARGVQLYFMQGLAGNFICQFGSAEAGTPPFPPLLSASVYKQFHFKDSCSTYALTPNQLAALASARRGGDVWEPTATGVLSTFLLDTVPCFTLFTFGEAMDEMVPEVCYISSWMIYHLLNAQETLSRYRTLKTLTDLQHTNLEQRDVRRHILDCLQSHYGVHGVSIIEYKGLSHNKHTFEKTFKHYLNYNHMPFATTEGFAFHCVIKKKALLIRETFFEKSAFQIHDSAEPTHAPPPPEPEDPATDMLSMRGDGIEFDPEALSVEEGRKVTIPLFRADRTVEDELSLMYYPLHGEGRIIGAIKIGDFVKRNAFDLVQLRALGVFSDAIVVLLKNVQTLAELRQSYEQKPELLKNMAQLLSYRNLIRDIFHQVGQYLNDIGADLLTAQAFAGERPAEELLTSLKNIRVYAKMALDLIVRARSRGEDLQPTPKDCYLLAEVVRPAIEYARKKAEPYKIKIVTTLTDKDYPVRLDADFAQESLKNILNNAIWAIREHKGAGKREIHIAVRESPGDKTVYTEIADSGIGIHPDVLPKVGTLFFTTRRGGSGVGLFSAKQHAEHFNGSVGIRSTYPGKGTTVRMTFPLREER